MARLPVPSSDEGAWGTILNEFLRVSHHEDGSLRSVMKIFVSVADMKLANLEEEQLVATKGYYTAGDDGGAKYLIKTAADYGTTPDEYGDHTITVNGNVAVLQSGNVINVKQFGTKGDGDGEGDCEDEGEHDTAAIQSAIDHTPARGVLLIPTGRYDICGDPAITFPRAITVSAYGAIFDYGDGTGTAVKLGIGGPDYIQDVYLFGLSVQRSFSFAGTANFQLLGIGILHSNIKRGRIADITVEGFEKGLYVLGEQQGNAYNSFDNVLMKNNLHGIEIDSVPLEGEDHGWCNEQVFQGGRVTISSGFSDYAGTKHVFIANHTNNHHRFIGMSLEGREAERKIDVAGWYNMFIACRYDGANDGIDIEFRSASTSNVLLYGHDLVNQTISDNGAYNQVNSHSFVGIGTASPSPSEMMHLYHASAATMKIEGGSTGSPSKRAILDLVSDIDYRARGILMEAHDDDEAWFAGVPYKGSGYSIGRHSIQPEDKENSLVLITNDGNVGIGTRIVPPRTKLDVQGVVTAQAFDTGDIVFRKDGERLWRIFENEQGLYLENLNTNESSRIFLEKDLVALEAQRKADIEILTKDVQEQQKAITTLQKKLESLRIGV